MWVNILLKVVLFMILIPGGHFNIPPTGTLREKALIHGIIFALMNYLVYIYVRPLLERFENPDTRVTPECPPDYKHCPSGDCIHKDAVHEKCPSS
jgi:hypothetical protein